ncbi:MAG: S8 family serine peptidase, partial [Micromonosporaceae bacterium]
MKRTMLGIGVAAATAAAVTLTVGAANGAETGNGGGSSLAAYQKHENSVPGSYLVRLDDGADPAAVAKRLGVKPNHVYDTVLTGFSAKLSDEQRQAVRDYTNVEAVSQNYEMKIDSPSAQATTSWGLDRIDQEALPLNDAYDHSATGEGVTSYIIDTGIQPDHPDFEGRAEVGFDSEGGDGVDCNGHGTHVAGTVGGTTYGVAPAT